MIVLARTAHWFRAVYPRRRSLTTTFPQMPGKDRICSGGPGMQTACLVWDHSRWRRKSNRQRLRSRIRPSWRIFL